MSERSAPSTPVVGAGPVRLTMAAELARHGVAVRIVGGAPARPHTTTALVVWSRPLELLDRTGCGAALSEVESKAIAVNITAGAKRIARAAFGAAATPHPYALMLPQSRRWESRDGPVFVQSQVANLADQFVFCFLGTWYGGNWRRSVRAGRQGKRER